MWVATTENVPTSSLSGFLKSSVELENEGGGGVAQVNLTQYQNMSVSASWESHRTCIVTGGGLFLRAALCLHNDSLGELSDLLVGLLPYKLSLLSHLAALE